MRTSSLAALALVPVLLSACGVKERIQERIHEEVAEKVIEVAAGGEVDVETKDGEVTIEGKDGSKVHVDGEQGKLVMTDAEGKTHVYEQGADGSATVTNSEGLDAEFAAKIPEGFPLALPPLRQVMAGQRVEAPDKTKVFSLSAQAQSQDLDETAAFLTKQFEGQGLKVETTTLATGEGKVTTLAAKNEAGTIEAGAMLSVDTSGSAEPGVTVILSWTDKRALAAQ